jgi:hypothetical protein
MMDRIVTFPAEYQKVILPIIASLGSGLNMMHLEMAMIAAKLAGEFIPPEDFDHNLLLTPGISAKIGIPECLVSFHERVFLGWSSPIPAR